MSRRRALDLFCGAGGAAVGLSRAGYEVVGVDIEPQPRYPFEFHCGDAMKWPLDGFDLIWASPPCQRFSPATRFHPGVADGHPDLIEDVRARLAGSGAAWVIENVPQAPLRFPCVLCGLMFGLRLYRHRAFECSKLILAPGHPDHRWKCVAVGRKPNDEDFMTVAGHFSGLKQAGECMGIDWMIRRELAQAIPPAYAEWIGRALRKTPPRPGPPFHGGSYETMAWPAGS